MRRVTLLLLLFFSLSAFSQDQNRISVGLAYGFNSMIQDEAIISTNIEGAKFNSVEIKYTRLLSRSIRDKNSWGIESGLIYSFHEFSIDEISNSTLEQIKVITIPVNVRLNFFKYFYGSAGIIASFELGSSPKEFRSVQDGLGIGAEIGGEYQINKSLALQMGTFLRQYNLLPFKQDITHDAISEFGFKLAMSYSF